MKNPFWKFWLISRFARHAKGTTKLLGGYWPEVLASIYVFAMIYVGYAEWSAMTDQESQTKAIWIQAIMTSLAVIVALLVTVITHLLEKGRSSRKKVLELKAFYLLCLSPIEYIEIGRARVRNCKAGEAGKADRAKFDGIQLVIGKLERAVGSIQSVNLAAVPYVLLARQAINIAYDLDASAIRLKQIVVDRSAMDDELLEKYALQLTVLLRDAQKNVDVMKRWVDLYDGEIDPIVASETMPKSDAGEPEPVN